MPKSSCILILIIFSLKFCSGELLSILFCGFKLLLIALFFLLTFLFTLVLTTVASVPLVLTIVWVTIGSFILIFSWFLTFLLFFSFWVFTLSSLFFLILSFKFWKALLILVLTLENVLLILFTAFPNPSLIYEKNFFIISSTLFKISSINTIIALFRAFVNMWE